MALVSPSEVPVFTGDLGRWEQAVAAMRRDAEAIAERGSGLHQRFQQLGGAYRAEETEDLLAATVPLRQTGEELRESLLTVARVLEEYHARPT